MRLWLVGRTLAGLALAGVAGAEEAGLPRPPDLMSLERGRHAEFVLGLGFLDYGRSYEYALEAEGELASGLLVGLTVPAGSVRTDAGQTAQDDLGNVGLGIRKVWSWGARASWHQGVGLLVWLPTATSGEQGESRPRFPLVDFESPQALPSACGLSNHPQDPGRFTADRMTLRPTIATGFQGAPLLVEAEAGMDVLMPPFASDDSGETEARLRTGLAVGAGSRWVAVYAELGYSLRVTQRDYAGGDLGSLALGIRSWRTRFLADLAVHIPVHAAVSQVVDVGVRATAGARF